MKLCFYISIFILKIFFCSRIVDSKNCSELLYGHRHDSNALLQSIPRNLKQYYCYNPVINVVTQQPLSCAKDNSIIVRCVVAKGVYCADIDKQTNEFEKRIENGCQFSNSKSYATALLLTVFFGWLGLDRFYLGYYAIGLLKLFSFGFFFILYLLDIVLIALQLLGPADGSGYFMPYYGSRTYSSNYKNESTLAFYGCFDCS